MDEREKEISNYLFPCDICRKPIYEYSKAWFCTECWKIVCEDCRDKDFFNRIICVDCGTKIKQAKETKEEKK